MARLVDLGNSARMLGGWPALVCVVASDFWQTQQAREALTVLGMTNGWMVYCTETLRVYPANPVLAGSRTLLSPTPLLGPVEITVPKQMPAGMQGIRSGGGARLVYEILYLVEQFPGAEVASISRALGSHPRYVSTKMKRLVAEKKLVEIDEHYYLTDAALILAAHRDRVHVSRLRRRFGIRDDGLPSVARFRDHDGAAFAILSVFRQHRFRIAGGWRGEDYSGGRDAIAPDGMIYLGTSAVGGTGWIYFEYERRVDAASGVEKKLCGYITRGAERPVLVAARRERVAADFRRQAVTAGLRLWAANIPSLKVRDPSTIVGSNTAWIDGSGRSASFRPIQRRPVP